MNACFINKKDEVFGDMNTFRIWRRWGHSKYMQNFFEIQGGWFDSEDPVYMNIWDLDTAKHQDRDADVAEAPAHYAHMIRIDLAEFESVVIGLLLDELDDI